MTKKFLIFLFLTGCLGGASVCGVNKQESPSLGVAPYVAGMWRIILLPYSTTCIDPLNPGGFVIHNPIDIPYVYQNGYNFYSSFSLDSEQVLFSGIVTNSYLLGLLEKPGNFMESLGGVVNGSIIAGTFKGQELPDGCEETGAFLSAIGLSETPSITGEWTITLRGTAYDCEDISDEGRFEKVVAGVIISEVTDGVIAGFFEDPVGLQNALGGIALNTFFAGAITDTVAPPTRVAVLNGTIYTTSQLIEGELTGELTFSGGLCQISDGNFRVIY